MDIISDPKVFYCPSQRFWQFAYPDGYTHRWPPYHYCSYFYRSFGQLGAGISQRDVEWLHNYTTHDMKNPIALEADIFHSGTFSWGPYPDTL